MGERRQFVGPADRRPRLMSRMMSRLGITVSDSSQAIGTCRSCSHACECEAWLSDANVAYAAEAPSFCPNAKLFRQLRSSATE